MSDTLLATKFYIPPVRPELIRRARLFERLSLGLDRKLTLVSAPAGYGKTTLLGMWNCASRRPIVWLSLDEGDNHLGRFFTYLITALQKINAQFGQALLGLLKLPQGLAPEALAQILINEIVQVPKSFSLVLDDYHTISDADIHEAMEILIDRLPPQMNLIISTRADPPLPLARLRSRGELVEIRQADLRFTTEETAALMGSTGLELADDDLTTLESQTEGWAAGLRMAALSMQYLETSTLSTFIKGFSGKHHYILDYLTDEVLKRQPEFIQTFLLKTSILDQMCGSLCDAVVGEYEKKEGKNSDKEESAAYPISSISSNQQILEFLERANLFIIPLDNNREWYRYHHLFAELLRSRLREACLERIPEFHRRAALWYEQGGMINQAVSHLLAAQDYILTAELIEHAVVKVETWSQVDTATFLAWMQSMPEEVTQSRPWTRLIYSRSLIAAGQLADAERILRSLDVWLQNHPEVPECVRILNLVGFDRVSVLAMQGYVHEPINFARRALQDIPETDLINRARALSILGQASFRAGDVAEATLAFTQIIESFAHTKTPFIAVPITCNLAETQIVQGYLRKALQTCEQGMSMGLVDGSPISPVGFVRLIQARILYERNDLKMAENFLREGLELLKRSGYAENFGNGQAILAMIRQAQGQQKEADIAIQEALRLSKQIKIERISILTAAYQARIWLMQNNLKDAQSWAQAYRQVGPTEYLREFEDLTLAWVLLVGGNASEALTLLEGLLIPADRDGRTGRVIEIQSLRALALQSLGESDGALTALKQALDLGEAEGYIRVFVDQGQPMEKFLHLAIRQLPSEYRSYLSRLLSVFPSAGGHESILSSQINAVPNGGLVEPLSERETVVLRLLAEGLTSSQIAAKLFVSTNTVRTHMNNIYSKLDAHNRTQAILKSQEIGLLPKD